MEYIINNLFIILKYTLYNVLLNGSNIFLAYWKVNSLNV